MPTKSTQPVQDTAPDALTALLPPWRRSLAARRISPRTIATYSYAWAMPSVAMQESDLMAVAGCRSRDMLTRYAAATRQERALVATRALSPLDHLGEPRRRAGVGVARSIGPHRGSPIPLSIVLLSTTPYGAAYLAVWRRFPDATGTDYEWALAPRPSGEFPLPDQAVRRADAARRVRRAMQDLGMRRWPPAPPSEGRPPPDPARDLPRWLVGPSESAPSPSWLSAASSVRHPGRRSLHRLSHLARAPPTAFSGS